MNDELEGIWKKVILAYSPKLHRGTEKIFENLSKWPMSRPGFEPSTSRMQALSVSATSFPSMLST
jgi:hypothetical protein